MNPFNVVRDLEEAICEYTSAPYAVAVSSCTMALLIVLKWWAKKSRCAVNIPKHTYVGVPMSIKNAGFAVRFRDEEWLGAYQLKPFPIYDCARWFTSGMYKPGTMMCCSFHATKTLGDTQGGCILLDDPIVYEYLKRMRFDGRTEGVSPINDNFKEIGFHCYMSPDVAARLLHKLSVLPKHNDPMPNDNYPDLSEFEVFK